MAGTAGGGEPAPFMMRAVVNGTLVEGQPLAWTKSQLLLLGRDGRLHDFPPSAATHAKKSAPQFAPYTPQEMAARIAVELGGRFETTITSHFVVLHPRGAGTAWGERLEELYRGFTHYMSVRGVRLRSRDMPLPAIVFRSEADYHAHAASSGRPLPLGTMGHYDPQTNRIYLFDAGAGHDWSANDATVIHEATHQTAYNLGLHERFAEQSRWAVEGLAMMFEAPGVWNAAALRQQADRINRDRLDYFRRTAEQRPDDWIAQLVASDRMFDRDALRAYAEAWTLTFYLCETRPQEYSAYLAKAGTRPLFGPYAPLERMGDFTAAFGSDLSQLTAQVVRFVNELP